MAFELKYYQCPKCKAEKLAKNLDNGSFVCDNTEGGCTHYISGKEGHTPSSCQDVAKRRSFDGSYIIPVSSMSELLSVVMDLRRGNAPNCNCNMGGRRIENILNKIGITP